MIVLCNRAQKSIDALIYVSPMILKKRKKNNNKYLYSIFCLDNRLQNVNMISLLFLNMKLPYAK